MDDRVGHDLADEELTHLDEVGTIDARHRLADEPSGLRGARGGGVEATADPYPEIIHE
jgi:hypothetical protein